MKVIKKFDVVMMKIIIDCKKNMKKIWFFFFYRGKLPQLIEG